MNTKMKGLTAGLAISALLGLTACGGGGDPLANDGGDSGGSGESITVGSADFAESQLLATIYSQALSGAGMEVQEQLNIGSREVYITALEDGSIDLIPEYNGYLLEELDPEADTSDRDAIAGQLEETLPDGLMALDPASAENTNTLVVTQEFSEKHGGLETISDLVEADDGSFTLAGPPEWKTRPNTGLPAIEESYGDDFSDRYETLDGGGPLSLSAVVNGQVDVAMLFSSDPAIAENDLVALEDDQVIFPPANIIPLISSDKASDEVVDVLNQVTAALTIEDLMEMNGRVNAGDDLGQIASDWLESVDLA